jgi:Mn2+/Fe2+ NRAMP family transporter
VGLARKLGRAKEFYAVIVLATLTGIALNLVSVDSIKALFWSAVINGIVAAPVMAIMMHLASRKVSMGRFTLSWPLELIGWVATLVMGGAAIGMFATIGS